MDYIISEITSGSGLSCFPEWVADASPPRDWGHTELKNRIGSTGGGSGIGSRRSAFFFSAEPNLEGSRGWTLE